MMMLFLAACFTAGDFCVPLKPHFHTPTLGSLFSFSESDVKQLWLQLKKDEPHLLSNFEDFLTRIFSQLQEAHEEKNELEFALKKWVPSAALCPSV